MSLTDCSSFGDAICPYTSGEFVWPFFLLVGKGFLEAIEDHLVGCFGLPITLMISLRGHVLLNAILLEELRHVFTHELWAIVGDRLRDAKSANDVPPYEVLYVRLSCGLLGLCFYPFGEVVGCHDHHASTPNALKPKVIACSGIESSGVTRTTLALEPL
ncbi:hypothetical protein FF1_032424 [Malus domestica]